ncbi:hypothetical protein ACA910_015455 [Epithemia clementina (nom. ined.)]
MEAVSLQPTKPTYMTEEDDDETTKMLENVTLDQPPVVTVEEESSPAPASVAINDDDDDFPEELAELQNAAASIWNSFTASAKTSWKSAMETTGDALEMSSDILNSAIQKMAPIHDEDDDAVQGQHSASPPDMEHTEEGSDQEGLEGVDENKTPRSTTSGADQIDLLKQFQWGWTSVVAQTKASMKQAEEVGSSVVQQSLKHAKEVIPSVVEQTAASFRQAQEAVASHEGWCEKKTHHSTTSALDSDKSDLAEMDELANEWER